MKHTPEPWVFVLGQTHDTNHEGAASYGSVQAKDEDGKWFIADICVDANRDIEYGNGFLIAAAPALLRRLLVRVGECRCEGSKCRSCQADLEAIAKAEGE